MRRRRNLKNENNANKNDETLIEMNTKAQEKPTEYASINQFSNFPQSDEWFMVGKSNISPSIYSQMSHIDASELKFEKVIGSGSFGQVW